MRLQEKHTQNAEKQRDDVYRLGQDFGQRD